MTIGKIYYDILLTCEHIDNLSAMLASLRIHWLRPLVWRKKTEKNVYLAVNITACDDEAQF